MKNIDLVYFDAGSGHRTAAESLRFALSQKHPEWHCRTVDLVDILAREPSQIGKLIRFLIGVFNGCMRREQYYGLHSMVWWSIFYSRVLARFFPWNCAVMGRFWKTHPPDAVISVTPMFNSVLYASARRVNPDVACITIPVDYEEMMSGYWFESGVPQEYILGCESLINQARQANVPASQQHVVRGMVIHPLFHEPPATSADQIVSQLGLDPDLPIGVISFGCQGTVNVLRIARAIIASQIPTNLVCLCGRNKDLLDEVRQLQSSYPCVAIGFRPEPPSDLLHAADFLIGKPGTMTLTEALITRTPFIALKSTGISPIQIGNEKYISSSGIGTVAESIEDIPEAIRKLLGSEAVSLAITREAHRGIHDTVQIIGDLIDARESRTPQKRKAA